MRRIFLLCLLIASLSATAVAQDTIYLDHGAWCPKEKARHYAVVKPDGPLLKVNTYTLNDTLVESTHYALYEKQKRIKQGHSQTFYPDGAIKADKHYRANRLEQVTVFYPDGKIQRKETYKNGKLKKGYLYDENGKRTKNKVPYECPAEFPGGVDALLNAIKANIRYPETNVTEHMQARVLVQFIVDRDGQMIDIKVVGKPNPMFDKAALETVKNIARKHKWHPGYHEGELAKERYTLPIAFRLK